MPGTEEQSHTREHRVNHRAAERDLCAKVRSGADLAPEDLIYLIGRIESLRFQLDNERDAAEVERDLRDQARRLAADERRMTWEA